MGLQYIIENTSIYECYDYTKNTAILLRNILQLLFSRGVFSIDASLRQERKHLPSVQICSRNESHNLLPHPLFWWPRALLIGRFGRDSCAESSSTDSNAALLPAVNFFGVEEPPCPIFPANIALEKPWYAAWQYEGNSSALLSWILGAGLLVMRM
jgi:hypothetical protein